MRDSDLYPLRCGLSPSGADNSMANSRSTLPSVQQSTDGKHLSELQHRSIR